MKLLMFSNPVFHDGINLTVRKGVKWSLESGEVLLADVGGSVVGKAKIHYSKSIPFSSLVNDDLVLEHDTNCRTIGGLLRELKVNYPLDEREVVTLLFFEPISEPTDEPSVATDAK